MSVEDNATGQQSTEFAGQTQKQDFGQKQNQGDVPYSPNDDTGTESITGTDPEDIDVDPTERGNDPASGPDDNFAPEVEDDNVEQIDSDPSIEAVSQDNSATVDDAGDEDEDDADFPDGETPVDPGGDVL
jgi:hypothetical protein